MPIEVQHKWAVTTGTHPDDHPSYCPLINHRHSAALTEYQQLLQPVPDNATSFRTWLADTAVMIPAEQATLWYRLTALAETRWHPVHQTTDPRTLLATAQDELDTMPVHVHGDHPGTSPDPNQPDTTATSHRLWCVTTGADPNDPPTSRHAQPTRLDTPGLRTLDEARNHYLTTAANQPGQALPTKNLTFWCNLTITAISPWAPADTDITTTTILQAIRTAAHQNPA